MRSADPRSHASIAGLVEAVLRSHGNHRKLLGESLMRELVVRHPASARIAASLLNAFGDDDGRALSRLVQGELGSAIDDYQRQEMDVFEMIDEKSNTRHEVDVLVLSVKEAELIACLRAFDIGPGVRPTHITKRLDAWFTETPAGLRVAVANVGRDGNVESALKMAAALSVIDFRLAVLVGMAAGVRSEVEAGDVVIAEQVWAADFEVLRPGGISVPRPKTFSTSPDVYTKIHTFKQVDSEWSARVSLEVQRWCADDDQSCTLPEGFDSSWRPSYKTGVIFAGSRIIEDGSLPGIRDQEQARLRAAEMEGAGFAAACSELSGLPWLVLRGIADFGETPRLKDWQFAATYAAAALLRDAIAAECLTFDL